MSLPNEGYFTNPTATNGGGKAGWDAMLEQINVNVSAISEAQAALDALSPADTVLVDSDIGTEVQEYDADILKADTSDLLQAVYGDEAQTHTDTDLSALTVNRNHIKWTLTEASQFSDVTLPYDGTYIFHVYPAGFGLVLAASYKTDGGLADPDSAAGEIRIVIEQYNSRKSIIGLQNVEA